MTTPTAETPNIQTPADDLAAGPSHLDAAKAFFTAHPEAPGADEPVVPTPTAPVEAAASSVLTQVVKGPTATVKAAAAPTEPVVLDDVDKGLIAPPDNAKSRAGWDELKKRATAERELRTSAEKKVADLEARQKSATPAVDDATRARIVELETENEKFSSRLKVLDLRSHPEFVQKFSAPKQAAKEALGAVLLSDEVAADLDDILALKGKAFNRAVSTTLDSLTPYARVKFQAALDGYIAADLGAENALAQADAFLKNAKQNTGARSREAFDRVSTNYRGQFLPIATDEKTDVAGTAAAAEYNTALSAVATSAEKYAFGQLDEVTAADLAHKAALYDFTMARGIPRIGQLFEAELVSRATEISRLTSQVKALSAARPTVDGGAGGGPGDLPPTDESHLDAARRHFSKG